jgi:endogenous inhibitor of DNA gyrase (YacG/DUF329 family)
MKTGTECGKRYISSGDAQKRCNECRRITCKKCGRGFISLSGHKTQRFCSKECRYADPEYRIRLGRWRQGNKTKPEERFWKYVQKTESCWNWTGGKYSTGYGSFSLGSEFEGSTPAHRFSYELFRGKIPVGMTIDHLCRNRTRVNPDHLEVVSTAENVLRGEGITANNKRKTHCKRGHPFSKKNTYLIGGGGRMCRACGSIRKRQVVVSLP